MDGRSVTLLVVLIVVFIGSGWDSGCGPDKPDTQPTPASSSSPGPAPVVTASPATDACLQRLVTALNEVLRALGLGASGIQVEIVVGGPKILGPNDLAQTQLVDLGAKKLRIYVKTAVCELPAPRLRLVLGHEVHHVQHLLSPDGKDLRDKDKAMREADEAYDTYVKDHAGPGGGADPNELKKLSKAKHKARAEYLKELKKDEERAYDYVKRKAAELGLGPDELKWNEELKKAQLEGLDKEIASEESKSQ